MNHQSEIKSKIIQQMQDLLSSKINDAETAITSAMDSRNNDTKSSAGDKYETGRAMMQMEIDNNELQLSKAIQQQLELSKIDINRDYKKVDQGSIVITNHESYFISIAMGKITVEGQNFYAISLASPVGMLLKNKTKGDSMEFQGRVLLINEIL